MDPEKEAVEKDPLLSLRNYLEEICNELSSGKGSRFYAELQQVIFSHVPEAEKLTFTSLDELFGAPRRPDTEGDRDSGD